MASIEDCLFNQTAQLHIVQLFKNAIIKCKTQWSLRNEFLYLSSDVQPLLESKQKKDHNKNVISAVYQNDEINLNVGTELDDDFKTIECHLNWILTNSTVDAFQLTWCILFIFYVSDDAKRIASKYSHPIVASEYFKHYNTRFEIHLCGQLKHVKPEKKSILNRQAKPPFEVILTEWLNYKKLHMKINNHV
jgi:hypothetical protein